MKAWAFGLAWVGAVALAAPAAAQAPLSDRERAYGEAVARRLEGTGATSRVQFPHVDPTPAGIVGALGEPERPRPAAPQVTGVRVDMPGLRVERLRFSSARQAQEHAAWILNEDGEPTGDPRFDERPVAVEVRGNQVVVVRGAALRDPAAVQRALGASWDGLPAPAASDAKFVSLDGPAAIALTTRLADGPLRASVDKALEAARRSAGQPGVEMVSPDEARVALSSGLRAGLRGDARGASLHLSGTPEGEQAMKDHLAALGGHPRPAASGPAAGTAGATDGAARALERMFGR